MMKRRIAQINSTTTKAVLVFAYGSNLDPEQMAKRCPHSEVVGLAYLPDYRLEFCGQSVYWGGAVANVRRAKRQVVAGVLYRVRAWDLSYLDICEGHPVVYRRVALKVTAEDGEEITAGVYIRKRGEMGNPSIRYFRTIYRGYVAWGIHPRQLTLALRRKKRRIR
jgi:cation transport regulator ChaC